MAYHPRTLSTLTSSDAERFWSYVDIRGEQECWPWKAALVFGYGAFHANNPRRQLRASRVAFYLHSGVDPSHLFVCHSCDNPACCNPSHLFLGTSRDNIDDMMRKGRQAKGKTHFTATRPDRVASGTRSGAFTHPEKICKGEMQGNAKLRNGDIPIIRERRSRGERLFSIAKDFGVSQVLISKIYRGEAWSHIA